LLRISDDRGKKKKKKKKKRVRNGEAIKKRGKNRVQAVVWAGRADGGNNDKGATPERYPQKKGKKSAGLEKDNKKEKGERRDAPTV